MTLWTSKSTLLAA